MTIGDVVHIIGGHNAGKSGYYIGHYLDSGYSVPYVYLGEEWYSHRQNILDKHYIWMFDIARPWDREIVHIPTLEKEIETLKKDLTSKQELLKNFYG